MAGDFRPLVAPRGAAEAPVSFKVKVVPAAPQDAVFVPHPAPVPAGHSAPGGTGALAHASCASAHGAPPTVTLRREGDRVTGIHIRCGCGQVIDLACQY